MIDVVRTILTSFQQTQQKRPNQMSERLFKKYGEPTFFEETADRDHIDDYETWFRGAMHRAKVSGSVRTEAIMALDGNTLRLYGWDHKKYI